MEQNRLKKCALESLVRLCAKVLCHVDGDVVVAAGWHMRGRAAVLIRNIHHAATCTERSRERGQEREVKRGQERSREVKRGQERERESVCVCVCGQERSKGQERESE